MDRRFVVFYVQQFYLKGASLIKEKLHIPKGKKAWRKSPD